MKNRIFFLLGIIFFTINAQTGNVGVNTMLPTETVDIDGTLRVRTIPAHDDKEAIRTKPDGSGTDKTDQPFSANKTLVADSNGVVGFLNFIPEPIPDSINSGKKFNTSNDSDAMFVIRRYNVPDWPSGGSGFNTGMDVSKWEAIASNIMYKIESGAQGYEKTFGVGSTFGYTLRAFKEKWRIVGDLGGIVESAFVDVLFINKRFVAADERSSIK